MRVLEALRPRVKDIDLDRRLILVRDGKGAKDRVTVFPESVVTDLAAHLRVIRQRHEHAHEHGYAGVELPTALERKYPGAHLEIGWQL